MEIEKPIFIIGVGRSGSSIFHKMFSKHPNTAWLSTIAQKYPERPDYSGLVTKMIDYPLLGPILLGRLNTFEAFGFWEQYIKGFSQPFRDLERQDVTTKAKEDINGAFRKIVSLKRNRLLLKTTGWPRVEFLAEIFEGAKFIHIVRDGRAVANSLVNIGFWNGWMGTEKWRWGTLPQKYQDEWEKNNRSFIVLAAIQWKLLMDVYQIAKEQADPDSFLELRYEDLCESPVEHMRQVTSFCDLKWYPSFEKNISNIQLRNTNNKWKKDLTLSQQKELNDSLAKHLTIYDYQL